MICRKESQKWNTSQKIIKEIIMMGSKRYSPSNTKVILRNKPMSQRIHNNNMSNKYTQEDMYEGKVGYKKGEQIECEREINHTKYIIMFWLFQ